MILTIKTDLETIVSHEEEIRFAIEELREKDTPLSERVEPETAEVIVTEDMETLSPVIEQQLDPETYASTSYAIDIGYTGASTKSYYESVTDAKVDDTKVGASFTAVMNKYEHELLAQAQELASSMRVREGSSDIHPFVEAQIDMNVVHVKNSVKTFSPALWYVMYEGRLTFN